MHTPFHFRKLADGLFLQCCSEIAELYPKIKYETIIIDNACMQVCSALHLVTRCNYDNATFSMIYKLLTMHYFID